MDNLNKIDQCTLFKLSNTILKAASLSMASDKDPSLVLAEQLKKSDVPKLLAKVATHAFNRRLSVAKLAAGDDTTKALSFPLADAARVELLVGTVRIKKLASLNTNSFIFLVKKSNVRKLASVTPAPEALLTNLQGMKKLLKIIDQGTISMTLLMHDILMLLDSLLRIKKKACAALLDNCKLSRQLATHYGADFASLFKLLPLQYLNKYAAYTILPKNITTLLVDKAILLQDSIAIKTGIMKVAAENLNKLCDFAAECLKLLLAKRVDGLTKLSSNWTFSKLMLSNTLVNPVIAAANTIKNGTLIAALLGSDLSQLDSLKIAIDPRKVISLLVLADDKYYDTAIALSSIMAHPSTKDYPVRLILRAINDSLIANPQYRSPRYLQHMLADVKLRLIGGGLSNSAGLAASALMQKNLALVDKNMRLLRPLSSVLSLSAIPVDKPRTKLLERIAQKLKLRKDFAYAGKDPVSAIVDLIKLRKAKDLLLAKLLLAQTMDLLAYRYKAMDLEDKRRLKLLKLLDKAKLAVIKFIANHKSIMNPAGTRQPLKQVHDPAARQRLISDASNEAASLLGGGSYIDLAKALGITYKDNK